MGREENNWRKKGKKASCKLEQEWGKKKKCGDQKIKMGSYRCNVACGGVGGNDWRSKDKMVKDDI